MIHRTHWRHYPDRLARRLASAMVTAWTSNRQREMASILLEMLVHTAPVPPHVAAAVRLGDVPVMLASTHAIDLVTQGWSCRLYRRHWAWGPSKTLADACCIAAQHLGWPVRMGWP